MIEAKSIYIAINPTPMDLPDENRPLASRSRSKEAKKKGEGQPSTWNGENYAIERFGVGRTPLEERPEIYFYFRIANFYTR